MPYDADKVLLANLSNEFIVRESGYTFKKMIHTVSRYSMNLNYCPKLDNFGHLKLIFAVPIWSRINLR